MFLATVGVNAGSHLCTVAESGFTIVFIGVAVLFDRADCIVRRPLSLKVPYDDLFASHGATGNPAISFIPQMAPTERPDIGYAMIFPSMTIVKVIAVQIVGLLAGAGAAGG
jgi:putative transport protein